MWARRARNREGTLAGAVLGRCEGSVGAQGSTNRHKDEEKLEALPKVGEGWVARPFQPRGSWVKLRN